MVRTKLAASLAVSARYATPNILLEIAPASTNPVEQFSAGTQVKDELL